MDFSVRMVYVAETDELAREEVAPRVLAFWGHTARTTAPDYKSPGPAKDQVGYEYWLQNNPGLIPAFKSPALNPAGVGQRG